MPTGGPGHPGGRAARGAVARTAVVGQPSENEHMQASPSPCSPLADSISSGERKQTRREPGARGKRELIIGANREPSRSRLVCSRRIDDKSELAQPVKITPDPNFRVSRSNLQAL